MLPLSVLQRALCVWHRQAQAALLAALSQNLLHIWKQRVLSNRVHSNLYAQAIAEHTCSRRWLSGDGNGCDGGTQANAQGDPVVIEASFGAACFGAATGALRWAEAGAGSVVGGVVSESAAHL